MNIHEYQAKELFKKYRIPIPDGGVAFNVDSAVSIAEELHDFPVIVKAQVHAGGRGKAGGVKLANNMSEVKRLAKEMLGMTLVTNQTGPKGKLVNKILIESGVNIDKELYFSILPDRTTARLVIMASRAGGMDIEEVAATTPERIVKVYIDPLSGIQGYQLRQLAFGLQLPSSLIRQFSSIVRNLYELFVMHDCSLLEINPLIITTEEQILAIDAKINFDDNALFRQKEILEYRDFDEEDPLEVEASKYQLNYIKMDGNIGNMVNGAGLAMATMDIIKQAGAEPANFLDVGGGANTEQVENAFRIMLSDQNVKGILINIFGGILRCDVLATGVVQASKKVGLTLPVVVRMEGTNVDAGRKILDESGLNLMTATDLSDAAQKVAQMAQA
ncbi:MAG: Succinyl-CoA ligase [ADP-forming] subunit beta [Candidatus Magnetoglobus multicellularis str. Araruama]|uniref:Succinate--CoA ligase [ADP-forming] subunit beta n=1 Tax=Candidatus Magnetoglobus multicellularis str. Araruama TaxID=890399 RepID=A0A1V1PEQ8_9BACT|nr:MAG: Succinyl-CoA ligase [ADP-forming] subunit beta [Candidatus Magnetoglobus multicellularis str. Araruama]